jgi:hypothetical protein
MAGQAVPKFDARYGCLQRHSLAWTTSRILIGGQLARPWLAHVARSHEISGGIAHSKWPLWAQMHLDEALERCVIGDQS